MTTSNNSSVGPTLLIDVYRHEARYELAHAAGVALLPLTPTGRSLAVSGTPVTTVPALHAALLNLCHAPHRLRIVLGLEEDPARDLTSLFSALEILSAHESVDVTIRTRSPMVLLTVPLLRRFGGRASVEMCIETLDDDLSRRVTPEAGRPAERLEAARALSRTGLTAVLTVTPLIPQGPAMTRLVREFAQTLREHPTPARLCSPRDLRHAQGGAAFEQRRFLDSAHHRLDCLLRQEQRGVIAA